MPTTSLIDLPEEVLLQVARRLRDCRATLAALMQTHSVLLRIAAPFLYASPFRLLEDEPNFHWNTTEKTRRYDRLVHLLLVSSGLLLHKEEPVGGGGRGYRFQDDNDHGSEKDKGMAVANDGGSATPFLRLRGTPKQLTNGRLPSYGPEVIPLDLPTSINYLVYYTDMHHDPMLHEAFMTLFPFIPHCYRAHPVAFAALIHTHNQIELAMLDRLASQIQSLTITMYFHIPRIKIPWLSHLRRLEILGTEFGLLTPMDFKLARYRISNRATRSAELQSGTWTRLDQLLVFITDHNRIHGTLRELKIENNPEVSPYLQPSERLIEIVEIMGDQLQVLDVECWPDAVWFLDRIPTTNLRKLKLHRSKTPIQNFDHAKFCRFLENSTQLEDLQTFIAQPDIFSAWRPSLDSGGSSNSGGVDEPGRTILVPTENYIRSTNSQHSQPSAHMAARPWRQRRGMKRIELMGYAEVVNTAVNEATVLFAETLESITVRSWFSGKLSSIPLSWTTTGSTSSPSFSHDSQRQPISIPSSPLSPSSQLAVWLPQLTELDLQGEIAWTFDFESLLSCPRLVRLRLAFQGPVPRRSVAKQAPVEILSQLWTLQDVELEGPSWETLYRKGWITTLPEIRNLERLVLSECLGVQGEDMFLLVQQILTAGQARCAKEWARVTTMDECRAFAVHPAYCEGLRYVHMSKRIEDGFRKLWGAYSKTLMMDRSCCPKPATLLDLEEEWRHRHKHRVQFSYLPQAPLAH